VVVSFIGRGNRAPGENHRPAISRCQTLSHNVVSGTPRLSKIRTHNISGTDCIGRYQSNNHTITTAPNVQVADIYIYIYIITAVLKVETDIITSITVSPIGNEQKVYYNKHNLFLLHVLQENDLSLRQTRFDCSFFL
jgi:hypothetical protein